HQDSDGDGIEDDLDKCNDTPQGIRVDEFGCTLDSDKDNVPDQNDKCENTPIGVKVDSKGCPLDSDKDGVADYLDKCQQTPANVKVDQNGCPFDTDKDGVPDYLDKCPGSNAGVKVDASGCEIKVNKTMAPLKKIKKLVLNGSSNFEGDNTVLNAKAIDMLSRLVPVMKEYPETRWEIIGHTDNTGSYANNKMVSLEKAKSVLEYFVNQGISRSRFDISGRGSEDPIGDNKTEAGRELNRRVEIINLSVPDSDDTQKGILTQKVYNYSNEKFVSNKIFTDGNLFMIEVSNFRSQIEAQQEGDKLRAAGHNTIVVSQKGSYSVRVGYFNSEEEAKEYLDKNLSSTGTGTGN
ncbi:MAG TPA: OmpA family protein, partial [Ignavibacteriaceae bacterium]|nr:OmpA family protein [Ignavibacteriaceae bacterium]